MAPALAQLWKEWGIQILVLSSFTLQVLLLAMAGMRRRGCSAPVRILLWLMYQLADSTALYTLGHLSVASGSAREPHLVAYWAPFLLVHLGGPGNITAYSIEDNQLWRRHLLTLLVQVAGAAFVIYKYVAASGEALLLLSSVLVFVVGVLRYGERTWALWCGTMRGIWRKADVSGFVSHWQKLEWPRKKDNSSFDDEQGRLPEGGGGGEDDDEEEEEEKKESRLVPPLVVRPGLRADDDEVLLLGAHTLLYVCRCVLIGSGCNWDPPSEDLLQWCDTDPYGLAEMELSLMFDVLYTKAAVTYTWFGCVVLVVSPLASGAALLLFHHHHSSSSSSAGGDNLQHADSYYRKVNVGISYALLFGTLALEIISVARAIGSTWACALMYCCRWNKLLDAVMSLRRCIGAASKRRWPHSIGQYSLLRLCTRDRADLLCTRLAARLGLGQWWNNVCCSSTVSISTTDDFLMDRLKEYHNNHHGAASTAVDALRSRVEEEEETFEAGRLYTSLSSEYTVPYAGILCWHVATDIYLSLSKVAHNEQLVKAVQLLSNYMMFLLMVKPEMLADSIVQERCVFAVRLLDKVCEEGPTNQNHGPLHTCWSMLKKMFQFQRAAEPNGSRIPQGLAAYLLTNYANELFDGPQVASELLEIDSEDMLDIIFRVWAEKLFNAAHSCSGDSHARQLNNGVEFITILWLWSRHEGERFRQVREVPADLKIRRRRRNSLSSS